MEQNFLKKQSLLEGFAVAFSGLKTLVANERNFRLHLLFGFIALAACFFFQVTTGEWIVVLLLIALVLCAEALNTGIEYLCDIVSPEYHPMIKKTKDVAAGAVLLTAVAAVVIGCIIFIPYLIRLL